MQLADIAPKDRLIVSLDLPAMEPAGEHPVRRSNCCALHGDVAMALRRA